MATLKKCDRCGEVWNPDDHKRGYNGLDVNRGTISALAPNDPSNYRRKEVKKDLEVCRACIDAFVEWLKV